MEMDKDKSGGTPGASWTSPTKKAKPSTEQPTEHQEERIWMDPNALSVDCGICFMPFEAEVFMHAPTCCPIAGCAYIGELQHLHRHLLDGHADFVVPVAGLKATAKVTLRKADPFRVLVMAMAKGSTPSVFLLVNGGGVLAGRSLSLVCLGPCRPEGDEGETRYKMEVYGGEPGVIWMKGTAPCVRRLEGFEAKKFLFVPDADWGPSGSVSVSIRIG
ncbi:hypothetical protein HU200_020935 [Digitaria exilis]|uniref:SIAH-type domain-containing protein n=1 Tax=Digitaria exilis TaxID=1010633 RepID=A0A835F0P3_9POAL|nr:hypothetical protein HU200_020935 [Digitaria exilis]CAB3472492.1 unnamed protein product [Digitaria exilis]